MSTVVHFASIETINKRDQKKKKKKKKTVTVVRALHAAI